MRCNWTVTTNKKIPKIRADRKPVDVCGPDLPTDLEGRSIGLTDRLAGFAQILAGDQGRASGLILDVGEGKFGRVSVGPCRFSRDRRHVIPSHNGRLLIIAVERGQIEGIGLAGSFKASSGDILLLDMAEAISGRCTELLAFLAILPLRICDRRWVQGESWNGKVLGGQAGTAFLVKAAIERALAISEPGDAGLCASLAALVVAAMPAGGSLTQAKSASLPHADLRRYVEANLADPNLTAARLAREFGMARASFYRQFGTLGGIAAYVRNLRLRRARELIERSDGEGLRLGLIGMEVGFASHTAFARAFRHAYGMTPRDFLKQSRSGRA